VFPAFGLGGAWEDIGLTVDAGLGATNTSDADDPDIALIEAPVASRLGVGAFWEGIEVWKLSMGPFASFDAMWNPNALRPRPGSAGARPSTRGREVGAREVGQLEVGQLEVGEREGGARLTVVVKPRSSRSAVGEVREDGALSVALKAPPVDGAANAELAKLLAKTLGVKKRDVVIVSGATGRRKLIEVAGLSAAELRAAAGGWVLGSGRRCCASWTASSTASTTSRTTSCPTANARASCCPEWASSS
jgi:uncharacterized protein (TIGR00251 family)